MKFFQSQYPIMCAVMNAVSDLDLAIACERAGITASLFLWLRDQNGNKNLEVLDQTLAKFRDATGHCNLVLAILYDDLLDYDMIKIINSHDVGYIEILNDKTPAKEIMSDPKAILHMKLCKRNTRIMIRMMDEPIMAWYADAYCAKGSDSAGCGGIFSVQQNFLRQKTHTSDTPVIPYGGIGTSGQIKNYLDQDAPGVALGTLFASSQESCISSQTKKAMTRATSKDLYRFPDTGQRALIMGPMPDIVIDRQKHWNKNQSLRAGICGDGTQGLIYAGESINHVKQIRTIKEIVDDLVGELM